MNSTIWIPTVGDAARCRAIELEAYGKAATLRQWQQLLRSKTAVVLATIDSVAVARFEATGLHLILVAVRRDARRQGKGRELVRLLGETSEMQLRLPETAIAALKFAVATGFQPQKIERNGYSNCGNGGNCDAILLRRSVTEVDAN